VTDDSESKGSSAMVGRSTGYLVALEKAKEERKIKLWHNRIAFLKKGNALMQSKLFGEAAVTYEKYLKILEMVYDTKPGELRPEQFKDTARTAELPVITSVYWDLMRIYDTSPSCLDRQKRAAVQLARFATMTPLYADILKKAEVFQRQCRNPAVVKLFLDNSAQKRPKCFIATAAFETPLASEVQILRFYRDFHLKKHFLGKKFVFFYYQISPPLARLLERSRIGKKIVRALIRLLIKCVS
jgi:hypothetical protein